MEIQSFTLPAALSCTETQSDAFKVYMLSYNHILSRETVQFLLVLIFISCLVHRPHPLGFLWMVHTQASWAETFPFIMTAASFQVCQCSSVKKKKVRCIFFNCENHAILFCKFFFQGGGISPCKMNPRKETWEISFFCINIHHDLPENMKQICNTGLIRK